MKILIAYGTTDGQTAKICEFIYNELKSMGYRATISPAHKAKELNDYDLFIIAASVHIGGYQRSVKKLVRKYSETLNEQPSAFLSVSLTAAGNNQKDHAKLERLTEDFLRKSNWTPLYTLQVAGALQYSKYNFIIKRVMKQIARKNGGDTDTSRDYEYTNWDQVKKFSHAFIRDNKFAYN